MTTDHKPDELERSADGSPGQSPEEATAEEERAWQEALRRARTEFADEDTDTVIDRPEPALLERTGADDSGPLARQAARPAPAQAAPPAAQQVAPPPPRKRRTSRPNEGVLPPQTVTVRRQRQTGRMDLAVPADQAASPADLASDAPADAPRSSSPASPPPSPAPAPSNATVAPPAAPPSSASAVARVLGDASARARERSREREALERVLAMAKPRTRQTRHTPAVVPPLPDDPPDPDDPDDPEDPDAR